MAREAAESPGADAKVRQTLATVLGMAGKYGDAETEFKKDLPPADAAANVDILRKMRAGVAGGAAGREPARPGLASATPRCARSVRATRPRLRGLQRL